MPKSFFQLDVGSDSEASSLPRSLGGVSGPGQSNLSTEVAALIQSEMAASHLRNHRRMLQQNGHNNALNNGRTESPDMDFLEMDFDPGDDSESEENKDESEPPPPMSNGHLGNYASFCTKTINLFFWSEALNDHFEATYVVSVTCFRGHRACGAHEATFVIWVQMKFFISFFKF